MPVKPCRVLPTVGVAVSGIAPLRSRDPVAAGPYRLLGRLGHGGQGVVYLGQDAAGAPVAVKVLHVDWAESPQARAQFVREIAAARQVAAFCTARILDADVDGDLPYVVSEYIEGPTLYARVRERGPVEGTGLDRLAVGTATALAAIHQAGVVHRDFKPGNVILGPDGPRVIDFGIAHALDATVTVTSRVIGTPPYMAPEQFTGVGIGPRADVFAWAATIVFAASGRPPFGDDTGPAIMNRILHAPPDLGAMTGRLAALVAECLGKEPAGRPSSQQVLLRLLGEDVRLAATTPLETVLQQGSEVATPGPAPGSAPPGSAPPGSAPSGSAPAPVGSARVGSAPVGAAVTVPARPPAAAGPRRVGRQVVNPAGITTAAVLGLAGGAVVELTRHATVPAAVTAGVTFAVAYAVRLAVALAVQR
jgi:eukaryotic-like serine/threonine-protein kinase